MHARFEPYHTFDNVHTASLVDVAFDENGGEDAALTCTEDLEKYGTTWKSGRWNAIGALELWGQTEMQSDGECLMVEGRGWRLRLRVGGFASCRDPRVR